MRALIHRTLALVNDEFRTQAAFNFVSEIAANHRIQCSPGIRDSTRYICDVLLRQGVQTELLDYPARSGVQWWSQSSFPEWNCRHAELTLLEDGKRVRLCSFDDSRFSLIQRSASTGPAGITTTIVLVENADDPAAYAGVDVRGKLVFSRGEVPGIASLAVDRFGAAGIVLDTMRDHPPVRDRFSLPDGRQYLSFWPGDFTKHKALGFVITPRQGAMLRSMFAAGKTELAAHAVVDSEYCDGVMEIASATIPGETDEEVVGMAHVCHPEPSANDNASGCGALMETALTLSRLIGKGSLKKPRRTIRFLWLAEMSGSNAYLANNEDKLAKTIAAINLDMVGENQDLCGSTFFVEKPLRALDGFGGDLAEAIMHLLTTEKGGGRSRPFQDFRWAPCPFSGGSDHNIWGDPTVGVTCPMLEQMPDKFYHTSEDTIDKVDPRMLGVAGILTAVYLYEAACATPTDASFLADQMATRFSGELDCILSPIIKTLVAELGDSAEPATRTELISRARQAIERRITFADERKHLDIESLLRLTDDSPSFSRARQSAHDVVSAAAKYMLERSVRDLTLAGGYAGIAELPAAWQPSSDPAYREAASIVPRRAYRGPFATSGRDPVPEYEAKAKAFQAKHACYVPSNHLQYWANGKRNLAEIADLIQGETGFCNTTALVDYYRVMVSLGVFVEN